MEFAAFATELHPCALETLPCGEDNQDLLIACGCYELDESSQHRNGQIAFYRSSSLSEDTPHIETFSSPIASPAGVLDLKLCPEFVCAALASETLQLYSVDAVLNNTHNSTPTVQASKEGEGLFLAVDISTHSSGENGVSPQKFAVSTQSGSVVVFDLTSSELREEVHISSTHVLFGENMPVWTVAWNPHQQSVLLSGGDDCAFRLWDTRSSGAAQQTNKSHSAGVTSAKFHSARENLLLTGSYDESCMFWDMRNLRRPLHTLETGGGVWRMKWATPPGSQYDYLATGNMQGGSHIYQIDLSDLDNINIVNDVHFTDNKEKHLAYGLGVLGNRVVTTEDGESVAFTMSTCTFYDSTTYFWKASMPFTRS